ncbi:WD40-repeat-containing domain protein [Lipomyces oligophaga]|uniref:WD40-repeat-containing domain protein n=1 Tax=Lipomyces oligophaga TaxID=45792 RepID=UPI0034CE4F07
MATTLPPPSKRARREAQLPRDTNVIPSDLPSVPVVFQAAADAQNDNEPSGLGMVRIPGGSTVAQMEMLLNTLLESTDDPNPYEFRVILPDGKSVNLTSDLYTNIIRPGLRTSEDVFNIEYTPQAVFRVSAVSRCTATMNGHGGTVLAACFSPEPNAGRVLTASGDGTTRVWDTETGTPVAVLKGHEKWVLSVVICPSEPWLVATGSMDCSVRLWDLRTGKPVGNALRGHSKFVTSLAFEPTNMLASSNSSARLVSASKDGTARIWDTTSRVCLQVLSGHTASITSIKWGGLGLIYTCSQDKTVRVWDASRSGSGSQITLLTTLKAHAHWVNFAALSTDYVLKTGGFDPVRPPRGKSTDEQRENPLSDGPVNLIARAKERFSKSATHHGIQSERVVTASDDQTMYLWDLFPKGFRSDSTPNMKPVARMVGHQKAINHVAFSADGRILASCSFDNSVKLWDGFTGAYLATLRGHVAAVYMCSWSADSRLLVTGSKDCTVKVWDIKNAKLYEDLPGHKDEVYAVEWSPDGRCVVSGGKDKTVKLWKH